MDEVRDIADLTTRVYICYYSIIKVMFKSNIDLKFVILWKFRIIFI